MVHTIRMSVMFRLIGLVCGISMVLFIMQPWVAENHPDFFQQGKKMADMTLSDVKEKTQEVANDVSDKKEPIVLSDAKPKAAIEKPMVIKKEFEKSEIKKNDRFLIGPIQTERSLVFGSEADSNSGNKGEFDIILSVEPIIDTGTETALNRVIKQKIWSPFKYQRSAEGFARLITEQTQIPVVINQDAMSRYQLVLEANDRLVIEQQIVQIEKALGLKFAPLDNKETGLGI